MDVLGKLFVKMEAERKLAEKILTDKIEDEKRTKGTTENETKLIDAFQTDKQADDSTEADVESSDTEIHAGMVEVPQADEITEATLEAAAETEKLAEEAESLQTEDEQTCIVVDAEDSDSAESLSQETEDTQTGKLMDDVSESVVEDSVAAGIPTEKIDDTGRDDRPEDVNEAFIEDADTIESRIEKADDTQTDSQAGEVIEVAAETERPAEEAESLQTEDEQAGIVVDAEDSDSAESLSQKTEVTQTGKLTDDVSESVVEDSVAAESPTEKIDDTGTDDQAGEVIETENQKDEIKSLKETENETKQSFKAEPEKNPLLKPDAYEKLFAKMEAERKLAEKKEAEEMLTDRIGDEKRTKSTIENETNLAENQKDDLQPLEEMENEKKQSVKVEPEKELLFKPKVLKSAVNNRTSDIKKPKSLKKIYLIGSGILTIIIAGVVIVLSNRTQSVKEDLEPINRITALVHTGNSVPAFQDIFKITRDAFDSEIEFRKHQMDAVNTFNDAVKHHNPDYQAATAILNIEGLDTKSGKFPLSIKWQLWTKQLDREGYINVPSDKAKALLEEGEQKPVYIYLDIVEDALRISKIAMIGLEEEMTVSFWPGGTIKHDLISDMEFVWISGRCFTMGSSSMDEDNQVSEGVAHDVCMNGFWMGRYEVTQAQWERIMGQNNSESNNKQSGHDTSNNPVMVFSEEFLLSLNKSAKGDSYRLPSEAEWEYAARAGSNEKYCFGDNSNKLEEYAWYNLNSGDTVHPVGQLKPNKWGLYDMYGNVWELCEDFWHPNYDNAPSDGSVWEGGDQASWVVRGGGFEDPPNFLRSASRSMLDYDNERQFHRIGFRLVRSGGFLD